MGKLQRKITGSQGNEDNEPILENGINKMAGGSGAISMASNAVSCTTFKDNGNGKPIKAETRFSDVYGSGARGLSEERHIVSPTSDRFQFIGNLSQRKPPERPESGLVSGRGTRMSDLNGEIEDAWTTRPCGDPFPGLEGNISRQQSPSRQMNNGLVTDSSCEIRWEDLQLGEEVGRGAFGLPKFHTRFIFKICRFNIDLCLGCLNWIPSISDVLHLRSGSFAAVHRGIWNGSASLL